MYTVVEKILGDEEDLARAWPVAGTSGYDFLNRVNNLFVATGTSRPCPRAMPEFTGETASFDEVAHLAKQQMMGDDLRAEVERLVGLLAEICEGIAVIGTTPAGSSATRSGKSWPAFPSTARMCRPGGQRAKRTEPRGGARSRRRGPRGPISTPS